MSVKSNIPVILCSHFPLPFKGIGSWTTMYNYYLKSNNEIDYVVCPTIDNKVDTVNYLKINDGLIFKLQKKIGLKHKYSSYYLAIEKYLKKHPGNVIIHIIDNAGFAYDFIQFITDRSLRDRCYIQFSYHGFLPYYDVVKGKKFVNQVDEFIFLTDLSKQQYRERYPNANFHASVLHNAIDKSVFKPLLQEAISEGSFSKDKRATCIFLWLANDRPKKGLDFILDVWEKFHLKFPNAQLWVVGSDRKLTHSNVRSFGKYPNSQLPKFYQQSDIYLFPTQCEEGFGLSLIEALSCGCYCIASSVGGVPEVLENGNLGVLVHPYTSKELWLTKMEEAYKLLLKNGRKHNFTLPQNKYNLNLWAEDLSIILKNAKVRVREIIKKEQ